MSGKARSYHFVVNNYKNEDYDACREGFGGKAKYVVCGRETAPTTGTHHLQGYVTFKGPQLETSVRRYFAGRGNWRVAKGNAEQNRVYCSKGGDFLEFGTCPKQGARTDLAIVREIIEGGSGVRAVMDVVPTGAALRFAEQLCKYFEPERDWKPYVIWLWGRTGLGKSRSAREAYPRAYKFGSSGKWWDGYDAHDEVIIDDLRVDTFGFAYLLRLLDWGGFLVEIKGAMRQMRARVVVLTAPEHPERMFLGIDDRVDQLMRRIDMCEEIKENQY